MPTLVASNLNKEEFEAARTTSPLNTNYDLESGGPLVCEDAKSMYVNVDSLSPDEFKQLGVPTCCSGSSTWFAWCSACCLLTVICPLAVFIPLSKDNSAFLIVAIVLLIIGFLWIIYSLRVTLTDGGVTMPQPPPLASAFLGNIKNSSDYKEPYNVKVKKIYVIVNPYGGLKLGLRALNEVCLPIWKQEFGMEVTVLETQYAGHARDYARTVDLEGYDGLCVIGGDGSIHEVINGLLQRDMKGQPLIPVGLIPGGSGNSTMLDLGTWSVAEAARRIGRGDVMWSDIIALTTSNKTVCSVNLVAWGLLGDIGVLAELFRCLGTSRYDIVGVWGILKGGGVDCKITYEHNGESKVMEEKLITGNVNLTQHFGKGLRPFPNARLDDGLMDLFVMKGTATRGELLTIFTQLPTGAQYEKNIGKTMFQSKKVIVELGTHGVVNVDGEVMKHNGTLLMENVSQIVPIFCPHTYEPVDVPQAEAGRATGWKP